jgi:hypothetical protein
VDVSKWRVFPSLHEESKEGWIWVSSLQDAAVPHILLRNPSNGRRVVCEQRLIDGNFRLVYNQPPRTPLPESDNVVVVSGYYRERLGLPTSVAYPLDLDISHTRGPIAGLRAGIAHPSSAIRTATWLGILSLCLGALSVALAVVLR